VFHVTNNEYHAWVEVLFPGHGWLAFEPTPNRTNPIANAYQNPSVSCPPGTAGCPAAPGSGGVGIPGTTGSGGGLPSLLDNLARREFSDGAPLPPLEAADEGDDRIPPGVVILSLLVLALVLALSIPPIRALRRRSRLHKAGPEPRALILATYDVFTERAADLGHPKAAGETLVEYRSRLTDGGVIRDGHLDRLTTIAGRAAYAPSEPVAADANEASEASASVLRDLRDRTPIGRRIAGQYRIRR
jgi:hypothetical protein